MKAYSQDLRERVLRAVDLGRPRAEIVQLFGVSLATIKRYLKQRPLARTCAPESDSWSSSEKTGTRGSQRAASITSA
jgi:transposase